MPGNVDLPDGFSDVGMLPKESIRDARHFSSSSLRSRPVERMVISTPPFPSVFISTFLFSSCPALNKRVIPSFVTTRRYSAGGGVAPSNLNASVLIFLLASLLLKVLRIAASGATPCNTAPRNSSGFSKSNPSSLDMAARTNRLGALATSGGPRSCAP